MGAPSSEAFEQRADLGLGGLAARGVAGGRRAAVAVPVPDVDAVECRRAGPGAAEGGEAAALLVGIGLAARPLVPGGGRRAGARAVAELGEDEGGGATGAPGFDLLPHAPPAGLGGGVVVGGGRLAQVEVAGYSFLVDEIEQRGALVVIPV